MCVFITQDRVLIIHEIQFKMLICFLLLLFQFLLLVIFFMITFILGKRWCSLFVTIVDFLFSLFLWGESQNHIYKVEAQRLICQIIWLYPSNFFPGANIITEIIKFYGYNILKLSPSVTFSNNSFLIYFSISF